MGQLDVHIRHGGGGGTSVAVTAAIAAGVVAFAAAAATARAVAAIPVWVWVLASVVTAAGIAVFTRFMVRHSRAQAAAFTARCEERRAVEAAERDDRRRHRLEVAAASAPVIHNHIHTSPAAIAAMARGYAPTVIMPAADIEEIR